jgi:hypothetical protein
MSNWLMKCSSDRVERIFGYKSDGSQVGYVERSGDGQIEAFWILYQFTPFDERGNSYPQQFGFAPSRKKAVKWLRDAGATRLEGKQSNE